MAQVGDLDPWLAESSNEWPAQHYVSIGAVAGHEQIARLGEVSSLIGAPESDPKENSEKLE